MTITKKAFREWCNKHERNIWRIKFEEFINYGNSFFLSVFIILFTLSTIFIFGIFFKFTFFLSLGLAVILTFIVYMFVSNVNPFNDSEIISLILFRISNILETENDKDRIKYLLVKNTKLLNSALKLIDLNYSSGDFLKSLYVDIDNIRTEFDKLPKRLNYYISSDLYDSINHTLLFDLAYAIYIDDKKTVTDILTSIEISLRHEKSLGANLILLSIKNVLMTGYAKFGYSIIILSVLSFISYKYWAVNPNTIFIVAIPLLFTSFFQFCHKK